MNNVWKLSDLIDLHYFCRLDEQVRRREGDAPLVRRDRVIFLARIEPRLRGGGQMDRPGLIRQWLDARRLHSTREQGGGQEEILPGMLWQALSGWCRILVLLAGELVGAGAAASLLLYSGDAALNVSVYFGLFVLVQALLIAGQALLFGGRILRRAPLASSRLYGAIGRMLLKTAATFGRRMRRGLSARSRMDLAALSGGLRQHGELMSVLSWSAFLLVQLGGIGFNCGVLTVTLAKVAFTDIAFAWQSSLQVSPEYVAELVRWIALPWWWIGEHAYPGLEQIQGSQVVLKEGLRHLESADLVAWWPFLCCAVTTYGLLPRIVLLALGRIRQRTILNGLSFSAPEFRALARRMTTLHLESSGEGGAALYGAGEETGPEGQPERRPPSAEAQSVPVGASVLVLIPDELYDDCPLEDLRVCLHHRFGVQEPMWLRHNWFGGVGVEDEHLAPVREALAERPGLRALFVLQEAWQPPLRETEAFLRGLRQVVGPAVELVVVLIGKPEGATMLTPADPDQARIWQRTLQAMGDPALDAQSLVEP